MTPLRLEVAHLAHLTRGRRYVGKWRSLHICLRGRRYVGKWRILHIDLPFKHVGVGKWRILYICRRGRRYVGKWRILHIEHICYVGKRRIVQRTPLRWQVAHLAAEAATLSSGAFLHIYLR